MSRIFFKRINKEIVDYNNQKNFEKYSPKYRQIFDKLNPTIYTTIDDESNEFYYLDIKNVSAFNNSFLSDNEKTLLTLMIPYDYPFKPYKITNYYNKTTQLSFHKYMNNIAETTKDKNLDILILFYKILFRATPKFLLLSKKDCYCCFSITCGNNWTPSNTISDLLLEYYEIEFINHYCKQENYKLLEKTHDYLFKNLFEKLPDEIIEEILNVYIL